MLWHLLHPAFSKDGGQPDLFSGPFTVWQSVTFTANINSVVGPPPDGEKVNFYNGAKLIGSGTLSQGVATFSTSVLPVGTLKITAKYVGDGNYFPSKAALSQVVNP